MLRFTLGRFASDSPFRHGGKVRVAPHLATKEFGRDVLLFASTGKLESEAKSVLNNLTGERPKAFWEILVKRTNESIHLLNGHTLATIMQALSVAHDSADSLVGVCRLVCDDVAYRRDLGVRFSNFDDSLLVVETILLHLGELSTASCNRWVEFWADNIHKVDSRESIQRLVRILVQQKTEPTAVTSILYKKLLHRWQRLDGHAEPLPENITLDMLVDTVKT